MTTGFTVFLLVILAFVLILVWAGVVRVSEGTVKIIERFGKYHRTLHPGINFILPGADSVKKGMSLYTMLNAGRDRKSLVTPDGGISTSEEMLDPPVFHAIASDNAVVNPDAVCYFRMLEPTKAVYRIGNLCEAMLQLLETSLRQEVGKLDSDALISAREVIGANIQKALERASEAWGTQILRVEIQEIKFSQDVQGKLAMAREAELNKRAGVVSAQQERDTEVLLAEGRKRARILIAEGDFEAAKLRAEADYLLASRRMEGEAAGTRALALAMRDHPEAIIAVRALEAQKDVAESLGKSSSGFIVPSELLGLVGALGAAKHALSMVGQRAPSANGSVAETVTPQDTVPNLPIRTDPR